MNIEDLRQLDLSAVCVALGLERDSTDTKQFKTEGFRICVTGFKWFDHNAGKGGGGAIDLTMHIKRLSFMNACHTLSSVSGQLNTITQTTTAKTPPQRTTRPPTPHKNNLPVVLAYLTEQRGLNTSLVQWCIDNGLIYADAKQNCVFRYGQSGSELRGVGKVQWRAVYGTIESGFILPAPNAVGVALLESAIDYLLGFTPKILDILLLSYADKVAIEYTSIVETFTQKLKELIAIDVLIAQLGQRNDTGLLDKQWQVKIPRIINSKLVSGMVDHCGNSLFDMVDNGGYSLDTNSSWLANEASTGIAQLKQNLIKQGVNLKLAGIQS